MSSLLNATVATGPTAGTLAPHSQLFLSTTDYVVFTSMLGISAAIGVYFGFFAKGADTTEEYLMGGKRLRMVPIAISLVASQLSAISIMSIPAEMYAYGINWMFTVVSMVLVVPLLNYVVIPVFYNNHITNCYEYLELRFCREMRVMQTFIFIISTFFMLPIIIFLPSLAFAQVTGYNVHVINVVVSSICIFYTMFGGIKAVVWTDVIQAAIMVMSVVLVGVLGAYRVGGLSEVLRIAGEGGRLDINYNFDLSTRSTIWNVFTSATLTWSGYVGLNQSCVQRIVALPSLGHARRSLVIFGFGFILIMLFNSFTGIVIYSRFQDCDPIQAGQVSKLDKIVPYFVQDTVGHLRGMPGVFISCVFSAALSTLSAGINSLGGVVYFDYIKPYIKHTEHRANVIMKLFVLFTGVYCVFGGLVVQNFNSILQVIYSIGGISFGSTCGAFLLGMLVPKSHGRAAVTGVLASIVCMATIVILSWGRNHYDPLPMSSASCPAPPSNATIGTGATLFHGSKDPVGEEGFSILDLSFNWYMVAGFVITWLVALPLSYILKPRSDFKLDPKLLSPVVRHFAIFKPTPAAEPHQLKLETCQTV
ncbi:sodium-coupled monocarboxylate transporter 2 isoform X1 [Drosophila biarmipes]|uniref:sodium-coupled monocarboxylate transporter 2 isoform X1 n=1 Tax=Drosophila biarmipes TaxID=125945 RepID=UPI0007E83F55|nr:sodium-coupled monocarboxylate transporter 2 isoform X1 [Drosophila biarmipes]